MFPPTHQGMTFLKRMWTRAIAALALAAPGAAAADDFRTWVPDGAGPHPTVLFVSGCSGFTGARGINHYEEKAAELRREGYFVVFVDYLARAGLKNCLNGMTHEKAAEEVFRAAAWARPRASRIDVVGWSFGGGATIMALGQLDAAKPPFGRAVLIYPDCRRARGVEAKVPTLVLLAGNDDVMPAEDCEDLGGPVKKVTYPGTEHGFDSRGLPAKYQYPWGGTIGYDAEADRAAWAELRRFLE
jgi:dienelactone hydrolase